MVELVKGDAGRKRLENESQNELRSNTKGLTYTHLQVRYCLHQQLRGREVCMNGLWVTIDVLDIQASYQ